MRVLLNTTFLASPRFGGSWTYTYNLLRALDAYSQETEFVVLTNSYIAPLLRDLRMDIRVVVDNPSNRFYRVAWEQLVLPRLARKFSPSVFHSTGNTLPPSMDCPMIVTMHDFQYHFYAENFGRMRRWYLSTVVPRSLKSAAAVACISESTRRHAIELFNVPPMKLSVIYEAGLWPGENSSATSSETLRRKYHVEGPILLSVGSSLPHKNLERLITAFGMVREDIPHSLVIVGERFGSESRLEGLTRSMNEGSGPRVKVTGFLSREDVLGLYQMADAFVFPSLFEGFGIPALEAMECGCPVIASSATSLPEVVGAAGLFFDPMDVADIARALKEISINLELRSELRKRGVERAQEFSWQRMGQETMKLYSTVVATT